jgi:hypothetical protein
MFSQHLVFSCFGSTVERIAVTQPDNQFAATESGVPLTS